MNKYISISVTIALTYAFNFFIPFAWTGVFAAIPLYKFSRKQAVLTAIIIGFIASTSMYIVYPISKITALAQILSSIINISPFILILLFPIIYTTIMGVSALFWVGLREYYYQKRAKLLSRSRKTFQARLDFHQRS